MNGLAVIIKKNKETMVEKHELESMLAPVCGHDHAQYHISIDGNIGLAVWDTYYQDPERYEVNTEHVMVACSAEIYNFQEFFREGISARNWTEAGIIAALYQEKGESWWEAVHGPFAAFIWDKKAKKGLVFTDRVGINRLMMYDGASTMCFASRINCLTSTPGFAKVQNSQAVYSLLTMGIIPTPHTIYKGITKLESGHYISISDGCTTQCRMYWKMDYQKPKASDRQEICDTVYRRLSNSTKEQAEYRSSIEGVGSFLSGGIDSSSIAGLMNELYPGMSKTITMGFDEPGFDEMEYARIAAKAFHSTHTEYYVTQEDILNSMAVLVQAYDEPFANSSAIPAYRCAQWARDQGLDVLLAGDGGDELFGGNERYYQLLTYFNRYPEWAVKGCIEPVVRYWPRAIPWSLIKKMEQYIIRSRGGLEEKIWGFSLRHYFEDTQIFHRDFLQGATFIKPQEISTYYLEQSAAQEPLEQFLYHDHKLTLMDNDLIKVGRMAESAGVKVRYPFLSPPLMEFSATIPAHWMVRGGQVRYIFKQAMKSLLPREIIEKTKKGFGLPVVPWMLRKGRLNQLLEDSLFDGRLGQRGIFRKDFIGELYKRAKSDKTTFYGTYLYYVLILELWLREHDDGAGI